MQRVLILLLGLVGPISVTAATAPATAASLEPAAAARFAQLALDYRVAAVKSGA